MLLPKENTFRSFRQLFRDHLADMYEPSEIDAIFRSAVKDKLALSWNHGLLNERFSESDINRLSPVLSELVTGRPLQYVVGHCEFLGCVIKVDESVLIPRPETEELCEIMLKENDRQLPISVLDIGTGSGCIPIALKKHAPAWQVSALDISSDALRLAEKNALDNMTEIRLYQSDVLTNSGLFGKFDIIVSNPPYIAEEEKVEILDNVLVHEPHVALFVPDTDTLLFYRRILELSRESLNQNGKIYFEINERFGDEMHDLMRAAGFTSCNVMNDLSGKQRFASCRNA
jgi:release factor glutamine methyltransferase